MALYDRKSEVLRMMEKALNEKKDAKTSKNLDAKEAKTSQNIEAIEAKTNGNLDAKELSAIMGAFVSSITGNTKDSKEITKIIESNFSNLAEKIQENKTINAASFIESMSLDSKKNIESKADASPFATQKKLKHDELILANLDSTTQNLDSNKKSKSDKISISQDTLDYMQEIKEAIDDDVDCEEVEHLCEDFLAYLSDDLESQIDSNITIKVKKIKSLYEKLEDYYEEYDLDFEDIQVQFDEIFEIIESKNEESKVSNTINSQDPESILQNKDSNEMIEITRHIAKRFNEECSFAIDVLKEKNWKNETKQKGIFGIFGEPETPEQTWENIKNSIFALSTEMPQNEIKETCTLAIKFILEALNITNSHHAEHNEQNPDNKYKIVPIESIINYKKLDSNSSVFDLAQELFDTLVFDGTIEDGFMNIASQEIRNTQSDMEDKLGLNGWRFELGFELKEAKKANDTNATKKLYNQMIDIATEALRLYNIYQKRWGEPQGTLQDKIGFLADIRYDIESTIESNTQDSIESTPKPKTDSKVTESNTHDSMDSIESKEIKATFTPANIEYLYEMHTDSPFATALWKKISFALGNNANSLENISKYLNNTSDKSSVVDNLFILDSGDKDKAFSNNEIYYKLQDMDKPLHSVIQELFVLKESHTNDNVKQVIKSYINEFLTSKDLSLEILDSVEIEYSLMLSATLLIKLSDTNTATLLKAFRTKLPHAIMQNAKAIMESKAKELEKRKDSINTKIESIKLNNEFESFLNHKGKEMLKELEL